MIESVCIKLFTPNTKDSPFSISLTKETLFSDVTTSEFVSSFSKTEAILGLGHSMSKGINGMSKTRQERTATALSRLRSTNIGTCDVVSLLTRRLLIALAKLEIAQFSSRKVRVPVESLSAGLSLSNLTVSKNFSASGFDDSIFSASALHLPLQKD
jgi:hypothetical protein